MKIDPIWSDSMGAKSVCTKVETEDTSILIDPGSAAMQPSYPMSDEEKYALRQEARREIQRAGEGAEYIVISHYHYDHFFLPDFEGFDVPLLLGDSSLWIKDPNRWINNSQWERGRDFLRALCQTFDGEEFEEIEREPEKETYEDPLPELTHALSKDFGDYQDRREELLDKWSKRFEKWSENWATNTWVREPKLSISVNFADGESFEEGDTMVEFSPPLFHGIEYSQTGWIITTKVEDSNGYTFLHTSDLQGPTIEDYADRIIDIDPDFLFLDGPATYLYGYLLNKTNLNRSVENAVRILREADIETFVYDHHLLREKRYRERTEKFWKAAEEEETEVATVAELKGMSPKILEVSD